MASQTKPSSPRSETMLKWNSSKVPTCSSVGQQQLATQERWTGDLLGLCLHCASTCLCQQKYAFVLKSPMIFGSRFLLASQSLQTLMREKDRRVMLAPCVHSIFPHNHYRNWCAQRKGDSFAFVLPFPPVFHLRTSFRYTNSNPLFPHGHDRTRSNDGCRMRVSLCAAPLWI